MTPTNIAVQKKTFTRSMYLGLCLELKYSHCFAVVPTCLVSSPPNPRSSAVSEGGYLHVAVMKPKELADSAEKP